MFNPGKAVKAITLPEVRLLGPRLVECVIEISFDLASLQLVTI
jgi:hypothetical protein